MQLATFRRDGDLLAGLVVDDALLDLASAAELLGGASSDGLFEPDRAISPIRRILVGGEAAIDRIRRLRATVDAEPAASRQGGLLIDLANVELAMPVPDPAKVLCVGRNYAAHATESGKVLTEVPTYFTRYVSSLSPSGQPLLRSRLLEMFDWEGELAVIIGKPGRHIPVERAMEHVAGYSCFNDGSMRDYQRASAQWTAGKNFERSGGFGPWLTTSDEIEDPHDLRLQTFVNGELMQDASTGDMVFPIPELIAYASRFATLEPGDVIATGTPAGVGSRREPPIWLRDGDTVTVAITSLGTLTNPVVDERSADA